VTRARGANEIRLVRTAAVGGGKASKGSKQHSGESCFATGGNAVNPRIGSGTQQGRDVPEEQTVEVVRNHEDGTQGGNRHSHPEGDAARRLRERGLRDSIRWRGDLWTTPREETRHCSRVARTGTRRESRRQGQEGRANLCANTGERTGRRSSRVRARRRAPRPWRAAVNGQGAATSTGVLPPAGGTCRGGGVARTMPQRKKRGIDTNGFPASAADPSPRGVRRMRNERTARP
jgi:hypothetical protein